MQTILIAWLSEFCKQFLVGYVVTKASHALLAKPMTTTTTVVPSLVTGNENVALANENKMLQVDIQCILAFKHDPRNNILVETERLSDLLECMDWPGKCSVLQLWLDELFKKITILSLDSNINISMAQELSQDNYLRRSSNPLVFLLNQIDMSIKSIQTAYNQLMNKVEQNKLKHFPTFRTTNYEPCIRKFARDYTVLQQRLQMFQTFFKQQYKRLNETSLVGTKLLQPAVADNATAIVAVAPTQDEKVRSDSDSSDLEYEVPAEQKELFYDQTSRPLQTEQMANSIHLDYHVQRTNNKITIGSTELLKTLPTT